jgi:hypothetical protein
MELLEAYPTVSPSRERAQIYEFRGRIYRLIETTAPTGQPVKKFKRGRLASFHVAADYLSDAAALLRSKHPEFFPNKVVWRGEYMLKDS